MNNDYIAILAGELGLRPGQVEAAVALLWDCKHSSYNP